MIDASVWLRDIAKTHREDRGGSVVKDQHDVSSASERRGYEPGQRVRILDQEPGVSELGRVAYHWQDEHPRVLLDGDDIVTEYPAERLEPLDGYQAPIA